jgi:hypothetical protein
MLRLCCVYAAFYAAKRSFFELRLCETQHKTPHGVKKNCYYLVTICGEIVTI